MERLANYQQMVDPTMVWGSIKSNDAVRMDVSFTWKKEEWLIPAVFPIPGGLAVDVARKLPYYHLKNRLTIYEKRKNAGFHSPLERLMLDRYDPFHFHPRGHLLTENTCIDEWRSERFIWNPLRMSPVTPQGLLSGQKAGGALRIRFEYRVGHLPAVFQKRAFVSSRSGTDADAGSSR